MHLLKSECALVHIRGACLDTHADAMSSTTSNDSEGLASLVPFVQLECGSAIDWTLDITTVQLCAWDLFCCSGASVRTSLGLF